MLLVLEGGAKISRNNSIDWGSVPDWIAAAGTILAFLLAAGGYVWSVAISRKAQARKVSMSETGATHIRAGKAIPTTPDVEICAVPVAARHTDDGLELIAGVNTVLATVSVINGSDEVMGPVRVDLASHGGDLLPGAYALIGRVQPGDAETIRIAVVDFGAAGPSTLVSRIVFRDSAGRWWQRFENESVRRARRAIRFKTSGQIQARALARAGGTPAGPDKAAPWERRGAEPDADGWVRFTPEHLHVGPTPPPTP